MQLPRFPDGLSAPYRILDGILPKLRTAPSADALKFEVLQVCADLCRRGGVWRQWVGPVPVTGEFIEIPIPPLSDKCLVHTVYAARLAIPNGQYLDRIDNLNRSSRRAGGRGLPTRFTQTAPGLIQLDAMPFYVGSNPASSDPPTMLECYVSLVPTDLCLPDWFSIEHYDTIIFGALGRLLGIKGPNYDAPMGLYYRKQYNSRMAYHKLNAQSGFSATNRVAGGGYFARGSQR